MVYWYTIFFIVLSDKNVPAADDGRANLMEAIRKAGGTEKAGLKNAKERKRRRKAKKVEEDAVPAATGGSGGGNLLGDLHAALSRRRKGISGRQDKDDLPNTGKDHLNLAQWIPFKDKYCN